MLPINELRELIAKIDGLIMEYPDSNPEIGEASELLLQMNLAKRDIGLAYD